MLPLQMSASPTETVKRDQLVRKLAQQAHLEARQSEDIRRDLAGRFRHSEGPFEPGTSVWYWDRDASKIRGGEWIRSKVLAYGKPPMVTIDLGGQAVLVNQSKLRKNPDPWHDVVIPGVDGRNDYPTVPGEHPDTPSTRTGQPASSSSAEAVTPHWWVPAERGSVHLTQFCTACDKLSAVMSELGDAGVVQGKKHEFLWITFPELSLIHI